MQLHRITDVALPAALLVLSVPSVLYADDYEGGKARLAAALTLQITPLLVRRSAPLAAVLVSAFGVAVEVAGVPAYGDPSGLLAFLCLVFATARWAQGAQRQASAGVLAAGFAVHLAAQPHDGPTGLLGPLVTTAAVSAATWALGVVVRGRTEQAAALAGAAERLSAERRRVVEEERRRIARELHDIVGHALSGIALTAGAASQRVHHEDLELVRALDLIRERSRDASADVGRLVGMLRAVGESEALAPQPDLRGLKALVERMTLAGLDVRLDAHADPELVPVGVQLVAYRVVQEGLTNVVKHAPGAPAHVRVEKSGASLVVEVDAGGPEPALPLTPGHGLIGLAERIDIYGGDLNTVLSPLGGLRLSAVLPLGRA